MAPVTEITAKSDFEPDEWNLILEGPMTAGMIVLTASGGGMFRETFALARAYSDARRAARGERAARRDRVDQA